MTKMERNWSNKVLTNLQGCYQSEQKDPSHIPKCIVLNQLEPLLVASSMMEYYEREVTSYDTINKFYAIEYQDGNTEDYNHDEIRLYKKSSQSYSTPNKEKSACYIFANKYNENIFFILTKADQNPIKRNYQQQWDSILLNHKLAELRAKCNDFACAASGRVWDDKVHKMA